MRKFIRRFVWIDEYEKQNPLLWPFLFETTAYGVAFAIFAHTKSVTDTILYQHSVAYFGQDPVSLWGWAALIAGIGSFIGIYFRKAWLGQLVSITGFAAWSFAFFIYMSNGFVLQMMAVAGVNMYFWVWWYFLIMKYHRLYG